MTAVFEIEDVDRVLKEYYPGFDVDAHYPRTSFDDYVVQLTIKNPLAAARMEEPGTVVATKCIAPHKIRTTEHGKTYRVKKTCVNCAEAKTPQWRQGPDGPLTLCNACGVAYAKHDNDGLRVRREKMRYML